MADAGKVIGGLLAGGLLATLLTTEQQPTRPKSRREWKAQFEGWAGPTSETESEKVARAERMVKQALDSSAELSSLQLNVFGQGSSINNTNVRQTSDVDLVVLASANVWSLPASGEPLPDTFVPGNASLNNTYSDLRGRVYRALTAKFGGADVKPASKCIKINETQTSRVACDVVPCLRLHQYLPRAKWHSGYSNYYEGVLFLTESGEEVHSFPELHLTQGRLKNVDTGYRYKQVVRVLKKFNATFSQRQTILTATDLPSSYHLEALVYNVPNYVLNAGDLYDAIVGSLEWLRPVLHEAVACNRLYQPNGIKALFPTWHTGLLAQLVDGPDEVVACRKYMDRVYAELSERG